MKLKDFRKELTLIQNFNNFKKSFIDTFMIGWVLNDFSFFKHFMSFNTKKVKFVGEDIEKDHVRIGLHFQKLFNRYQRRYKREVFLTIRNYNKI
jgi:hypothetical protein